MGAAKTPPSLAADVMRVADLPEEPMQSSSSSCRPSQDHLNALHARFGQNAARARAAKQRTQQREQSVDKRKLAQQRLQQDAEQAAKSEPFRRRAAERAASEQRVRRDEQHHLAQEEASMNAKRAANAEASQRYKNSAARRVKSEQQRRRALAREVFADLEDTQRKRFEEDEAKGGELQRRCESSDWAACAPLVHAKSARKLAGQHSDSSAPTSARKLPGQHSDSLPRIIPSPRYASVDAPRSHRSNSAVTHLPPLIPA